MLNNEKEPVIKQFDRHDQTNIVDSLYICYEEIFSVKCSVCIPNACSLCTQYCLNLFER